MIFYNRDKHINYTNKHNKFSTNVFGPMSSFLYGFVAKMIYDGPITMTNPIPRHFPLPFCCNKLKFSTFRLMSKHQHAQISHFFHRISLVVLIVCDHTFLLLCRTPIIMHLSHKKVDHQKYQDFNTLNSNIKVLNPCVFNCLFK
jgi:hypothetical protein